jgi:hypothetical protein
LLLLVHNCSHLEKYTASLYNGFEPGTLSWKQCVQQEYWRSYKRQGKKVFVAPKPEYVQIYHGFSPGLPKTQSVFQITVNVVTDNRKRQKVDHIP